MGLVRRGWLRVLRLVGGGYNFGMLFRHKVGVVLVTGGFVMTVEFAEKSSFVFVFILMFAVFELDVVGGVARTTSEAAFLAKVELALIPGVGVDRVLRVGRGGRGGGLGGGLVGA